MSPESFDKEAGKQGFSGKLSDIWALGVTFYAFVYLEIPFKGDTVEEIMDVV